MIKKPSRSLARKKRHYRMRRYLSGSPQKLRLTVFKSNKYIYAQLIDDTKGHTHVSASSLEAALVKDNSLKSKSNAEAAKAAGEYDTKLVVEKALVGFSELNCAVFGRGKALIASGVEQPVGWKEFLSFDDKYMDPAVKSDKGTRVKSPAQIDDALKAKVKDTAKQAFGSIGASGVARVDFLMDGDN